MSALSDKPGVELTGLHPTLTRRAAIVGMLAGTLAPGFAQSFAYAAEAGPPDVGVYGEPTMAPFLTSLGRMFAGLARGAPVSVLSAPADLILLQIKQNPAEDLLVVPAASMDAALKLNYVDPATRWDGLRNKVVLAARSDSHISQTSAGDLQALLANGRVAATDPTPASTLDGLAVLAQLGVSGLLSGRIMGAPDTANVAFLVATGVARFGLMYATDVAANPALTIAAMLNTDIVKPVIFSAALNVKPRSRYAHAFLDYLRSPDAAGNLTKHGLELAS